MNSLLSGSRGSAVVGAALVLQLVVLVVSMGPAVEVSPFCSGTGTDDLATIFGGVHLLLLALLLVGVCSLRFKRVRLSYVLVLLAALATLPVQAHLVSRGQLHCDVP